MKKDNREKMLEELFGRRTTLDINDTKDVLRESTDELTRIINQNAKALEDLSFDMNNATLKNIIEEVKRDFNLSDEIDLVKLKSELETDYSTKIEVPENVVVGKASREVFETINGELNQMVLGQIEASKEMTIAFRRPYVTGSDPNKIRNSILLTGSNGSGRHLLVNSMAQLLKKHGLIVTSEIITLDMSRYQSPAQETLFLQDLYVALNQKNAIIIIENMEEGHPVFNRMLSELVVEGTLTLNKRYVFKQNQMQLASDGLTSEVIDSLNGNNKVLVFISENSPKKMLDIFGKSFIDKVTDKIKTVYLDENSLAKIIDKILEDFKLKCHTQLEIEIKIDETVKDYLLSIYSPNDGVDSITPAVNKIYDELVDLSLKKDDFSALLLKYDESAKAIINDEIIELDLSDDSKAERDAIQKELDAIVGLDSVKQYLISLEDHIKVSRIRKLKGLKTSEVSKHMIFTGNPGTGKTTIARLVSRMMKACGILKQGHLVEVTRADLVAKYVGQTAPQTMDVIKSAIGGVLFIDEAYALYRGKDDSFGLEAIDTLVKAMEDHRDDLIVILAGYSKEMETFLNANSGLKSRFANIINFEDYTGHELVLIAKSIAASKDYRIDEEALKPLEDYFSKVQSRKDMTSGNGRLARNIVEEAILNQSKRVLEDDAEIDLLQLVDFDLKEGL